MLTQITILDFQMPQEPWERITYKQYGYFIGLKKPKPNHEKASSWTDVYFLPINLHYGSLATVFGNKSKISRSCLSSLSIVILPVYLITYK